MTERVFTFLNGDLGQLLAGITTLTLIIGSMCS